MKISVNPGREAGRRNPMIYGQFIEHFHRQIYGGVYDPGNPLADETGLRKDVLEALNKIRVPVLRWPGGCFVSAYHWKNGVGNNRRPDFDKAWRVEESNRFGTDEYIEMCRKIGCEPYICTNAGTGSAEEMSDWVEYCNLESEGRYAGWRRENGFLEPHKVKYWSIGNENYGDWEMGARQADEWGRLVLESAKMMKRVDPDIELSAAALADIDWNVALLKSAARYLDWLSLHEYWDITNDDGTYATYEQCMAFTPALQKQVDKVRGLLTAMGLETKIRIAFDEWNLRGWHHPNFNSIERGMSKDDYLKPRDDNDDNSHYTMADAVFTACFLNMLNRNCDIVGMANFAPVVNTRGCIYTYPEGIVLRGTYHVFDLYVNEMGDTVLDSWLEEVPVMTVKGKDGKMYEVEALDIAATRFAGEDRYALAVVNKHPEQSFEIGLAIAGFCPQEYRLCSVCAPDVDSYNDVGREEIILQRGEWMPADGKVAIAPHSVAVLQLR